MRRRNNAKYKQSKTFNIKIYFSFPFQVENQSDDDGQEEDWSMMGAELERELGS